MVWTNSNLEGITQGQVKFRTCLNFACFYIGGSRFRHFRKEIRPIVPAILNIKKSTPTESLWGYESSKTNEDTKSLMINWA